MNILIIGDIVGKNGLERVKKELPILVEKEKINFVIANGENVAEGMGITKKDYEELKNLKIDVITLGNHTWSKKEVFSILDNVDIIRPANYTENVPGVGYTIINKNNKKVAVINLIGRTNMGVLSENPFIVVDNIIEKIKPEVDIIIVDFHAEATAEKVAMGHYLDGRVNVVYGTHTHIQTADERISPKNTAYITDIGMTGPKDSVIGMDVEVSLKRFVTSIPERYKTANGTSIFNGILVKINDEDCRVKSINRIYL